MVLAPMAVLALKDQAAVAVALAPSEITEYQDVLEHLLEAPVALDILGQ